MGDTATAIAGAAVGFAIGGPAGAKWGWAIGSTIGAIAFGGGPDQEGPRLGDLQIQDSSYGKPIPIIYGRDRISGNIIWSKPLEEVENEESGKGGPTSTTYNYFATFALGLCEGEIVGVRRIWINNKLVYKYTSDATVEELLASNAKIDGITVYTGSETQDPDPLIQAHKGADNTPAFRGLAYLVFDRLDVGNSGQIPNITVEVVGNGDIQTIGSLTPFTVDVPDIGSSASYININKFSRDTFELSIADGETSLNIGYPDNYGFNIYTLDGSRVGESSFETDLPSTFPSAFDAVEGFMLGGFSANLTPYRGSLLLAGIYRGTPVLLMGSVFSDTIGASVNIGTTSATTVSKKIAYGYGRIESEFTGSFYKRGGYVEGQSLIDLLIDEGAGSEYIHFIAGNRDDASDIDNKLYIFTAPSLVGASTKYYQFSLVSNIWSITETGTCSVSRTQISTGACMEAGSGAIAENENYIWGISYKAISRTDITYLEKSGTTFTAFSTASSNFDNATIASGSIVRTACIAARDGVMLMMTQNTDLGSSYQFNVFPYSRAKAVVADGVLLSTIVSDLCLRAGLGASDIDVTDLTDTVAGYTVSRVTSARKAIEPLMTAYFFDGAEFNNKLNFIKRGGASALTIPEDDLGVDSDDLYTHTRQQESELPSEMIFNYKDVDRDFQSGSQRSRRINTHVENVSTSDLPIALTADAAKQINEINHYNVWVEREKFNIQLNQEYIDLNPTDVINFTADGDTRKARITNINYSPVMSLDLVAESGAYESDAVAGESESVDQTLGLIGPTNLQLLDIPLLRNQDNDTAIYAAASGYYNGWSGCRVYKSSDDVSYQEVDNLFETITQGYTTSTLADAGHTTWDRASTVTVKWTAGSAPASITESNALKGARYFLIGNEISVPVNETDNGDGTYTYDTFLRGRRGTDWATSAHATGERVIILNEQKMSRLAMVLSTARYFKGVSIGNYIANAESETFTNTGVSLKPFSPTYIQGTRDGSNNLTITWLKRSRYIGGALMPLPLFEDSESYKVEILDGIGGSVLRTISSITSETTSYSAANQTSDGLTPGDPIVVKVYQISATVGTGYGKEATV